jgi:hypothetical protein
MVIFLSGYYQYLPILSISDDSSSSYCNSKFKAGNWEWQQILTRELGAGGSHL